MLRRNTTGTLMIASMPRPDHAERNEVMMLICQSSERVAGSRQIVSSSSVKWLRVLLSSLRCWQVG